jgi:Protein of unknown function (DUF1800)
MKWLDLGDGIVQKVTYWVRYRVGHKPPVQRPLGPKPLPKAQSPGAPAAPQPFGVYSGYFGRVQATRLLNRAGFGPKRGEALKLAKLGLKGAVYSLTRPSTALGFSGPAPTDGDGNALAPYDAWGHDHLWWLDRMLRSNRPLTERMALIFHDWFATSRDKVDSAQLMINQTNLFRNGGLGSFKTLLENVTRDPAMLLWLDGVENTRWDPNENYGREVMELFTLGADRGAYTETDVREMARALTGWGYDWSSEEGPHNFRFVSNRWDPNNKTIFGHTGKWNWLDACRLCVEHPLHASFFVEKLWSYFVPTAPSSSTRTALVNLYTANGYAIRPVVEAILMHPDFYLGAPMVKPPIVFLAGLMRASATYVHDDQWIWLSDGAGQRLFYPPNVSGWDDRRWLDTNRLRSRWLMVTAVLDDHHAHPWDDSYSATEAAEPAFDSALATWDYPPLRAEHQSALLAFSRSVVPATDLADWQQSPYRALRQNALRQLIAISPDLLLS